MRNLSLGRRWVYVPCMVEEGSESAKGSQGASAGFGLLHGTMGLDWRLEGCDLHHCGGEGDKCTNGKLFPYATSARSAFLEPTRCRRVFHHLANFGRNGVGGKRCSQRKIARMILLYVSLGEMGCMLVIWSVLVVWWFLEYFRRMMSNQGSGRQGGKGNSVTRFR